MPQNLKQKPRFIPPVYFFLFLFLMIVLHFILPVKILFHAPGSYAGFLLLAAGAALALWARLLFRIRNIPVRPGEELKDLELSGPYRFTRNPMYLGMTLILLGGSVALGSLTSFLGPIAFWSVINVIFIPFEERKLETTFGQRYLDFKNKVRRWL